MLLSGNGLAGKEDKRMEEVCILKTVADEGERRALVVWFRILFFFFYKS
jgi:hypothetical protein